jgi:hypothetical protein
MKSCLYLRIASLVFMTGNYEQNNESFTEKGFKPKSNFVKTSYLKKSKFKSSNGYRVSKPGWRGRSPDKAASILEQVFNKPELRARLAQYSFVTKWHDVVGDKIAKHARPLRLQGNVLYVQVASPIWAQELSLLKGVIISRLKKLGLAEHSIQDLRFVVSDLF